MTMDVIAGVMREIEVAIDVNAVVLSEVDKMEMDVTVVVLGEMGEMKMGVTYCLGIL